jgi:hypothetical protein
MTDIDSQEPRCSVIDGDLVITRSGQIIWRGRPRGLAVVDAFRLEGTEDFLVLLERGQRKEPKLHNVVRCGTDGSVMLEADLPQGEGFLPDLPWDELPDAYARIWRDKGAVGATSWSGYSVYLDINSGRILRQVFVK